MYDSDLDLEALMQEPPGGLNHGRAAGRDGQQSLSTEETQAEEFMKDGGFRVVSPSTQGAGTLAEAGMTAHRGVLQVDEYVDHDRVRQLAAAYLGVSLDEIEDAYRNGRPTTERARNRAAIDARLLALSRRGGNLTALARVLGWEVDGTGSCWRMKKALERARAAEAVAS